MIMIIYRRGDIVFFNNVRFSKETIDLKVNGHPYLILRDVDEFGHYIPCLKVTSKRAQYAPQFGLSKKVGMKKKSYVDLKKIWYLRIDERKAEVAHLTEGQMEQLIEAARRKGLRV